MNIPIFQFAESVVKFAAQALLVGTCCGLAIAVGAIFEKSPDEPLRSVECVFEIENHGEDCADAMLRDELNDRTFIEPLVLMVAAERGIPAHEIDEITDSVRILTSNLPPNRIQISVCLADEQFALDLANAMLVELLRRNNISGEIHQTRLDLEALACMRDTETSTLNDLQRRMAAISASSIMQTNRISQSVDWTNSSPESLFQTVCWDSDCLLPKGPVSAPSHQMNQFAEFASHTCEMPSSVQPANRSAPSNRLRNASTQTLKETELRWCNPKKEFAASESIEPISARVIAQVAYLESNIDEPEASDVADPSHLRRELSVAWSKHQTARVHRIAAEKEFVEILQQRFSTPQYSIVKPARIIEAEVTQESHINRWALGCAGLSIGVVVLFGVFCAAQKRRTSVEKDRVECQNSFIPRNNSVVIQTRAGVSVPTSKAENEKPDGDFDFEREFMDMLRSTTNLPLTD